MDEWLEPLFDRHQNDENRHADMWFRLLSARRTFDPDCIPSWANTVAAFSHRGWLDTVGKLSRNQPIHQVELIPMFAGIHALEYLAVRRFRIMSDLHRKIDPEISQLLDTVIKDERFHQAYTKRAVLRLGRRYDCLPWAKECLEKAVKAYQKYALSLMPNYIELLRPKGATFAPWFLALNEALKVYSRLRPQLEAPPPMPKRVAQAVMAVGSSSTAAPIPVGRRAKAHRAAQAFP
jgi:hypothetical protein